MNEAGRKAALIDDVRVAEMVSAITRTAFNAILDGRALSRAELIAATGADPAAIEWLIGRALIRDANDRVVAAHGLSLVPARQHRITMRGRQFWTWCAIDAVGIPACLGEQALVETTCTHCGTVVRLEMDGLELLSASHPNARLWDAARQQGRGTAGPPHCALMNLFCSAERLRAWSEAHPDESDQERDLGEIATLGRAEWGYIGDASAKSCACGDPCGDGNEQDQAA